MLQIHKYVFCKYKNGWAEKSQPIPYRTIVIDCTKKLSQSATVKRVPSNYHEAKSNEWPTDEFVVVAGEKSMFIQMLTKPHILLLQG